MLLSTEDILRECDRLGLEISERTFRYYSVLGVLPSPVRHPDGEGDGRVRYYTPDLLDRLKEIRALQARGYSLKQIRSYFEAPPETGDARTNPGDLLSSLLGGRLEEIAQGLFERSDDVRACIDAYVEMTELFTGSSNAGTHLREQIGALEPLQLERLVRPIRRWKERLSPPAREKRVPGLLPELRRLAERAARGEPVDADALETVRRSLDRLARRTARLDLSTNPMLEAGRGVLTSVLSELNSIGLEEPERLDACEQRLDALEQMLQGYRALAGGA